MKKILLPIDGSKRSMKSVELVKSLYAPRSIEITIITVLEDLDDIRSKAELEQAKKELYPMLFEAADQLKEYTVKQRVLSGKAGEEILNYAQENGIDIIFITKSTKKGWSSMIGSVAIHVVKYAKCYSSNST
jgi:nucleotide-binding universal stress UspA family protein